MNLTETILVLAVSIIVVAGVAVVFSNARDKHNQTKTMQSLLFMRANIEQVFANADFTGLDSALLRSGNLVPAELEDPHDENAIRSIWGPIEVAGDGKEYTITLTELNTSACQGIAILSTTSWSKVEVGGQELYNRDDNQPINNLALVQGCSGKGDTNSITFTAP